MVKLSREELHAYVKQHAPDVAAVVDEVRAVFGPCKVSYLKVGELEMGTPMSNEGFGGYDMTPTAEAAKRFRAAVAEEDARLKRLSGPRRRKVR